MEQMTRFENALRSPAPGQALRSLALELARQGQTRQQVYQAFETFLLDLRKREPKADHAEDLILDTMDALSGWCHSDAELLADS